MTHDPDMGLIRNIGVPGPIKGIDETRPNRTVRRILHTRATKDLEALAEVSYSLRRSSVAKNNYSDISNFSSVLLSYCSS
jgi:hypothetical protein